MLLTRTPLNALLRPLDLHVLGTPPTFVLSQDQTRQLIWPDFLRSRCAVGFATAYSLSSILHIAYAALSCSV